jgi:mannose-6-phosphate isomerase-like protein (cupin superfamily)
MDRRFCYCPETHEPHRIASDNSLHFSYFIHSCLSNENRYCTVAEQQPHDHMEGSQEFVTVFDGELTISINEHQYIVKNGDSIRFRADVPHVYHNAGDSLVRVSMVIYYPE